MSLEPLSRIWEAFHPETTGVFSCGRYPEEVTAPAKAEGKGLPFNPEVCLPLSAERLALLNEARDFMAQGGITSIQNADQQG